MSLPDRQRRLLGVLAALLVVVAGRWLWPRLAGDGAGAAGSRLGRAAVGAGVTQVEDLRLADLEAPAATYTSGRDLFSYGEPPRPPGPTPEQLAAAERLREADAATRAALAAQRLAQTPVTPPAPQPPEIGLRYYGSFGPDFRIAVFSDGENIYNALEGDVLEGKFIVDSIGLESVDVRFVGFPDAPARRLSVGGQ